MNSPKPCPMCGATTTPNAKRCLSCGESFAPIAPMRALLLAPVNTAGMLPGALVGAATYLVYAILAFVRSPGFGVAPLEPVVGVLAGVTVGALIGSALAAGVRGLHGIHPESDRA